MNVSQFSIIIRHTIKQLTLRGFTPNKKLNFNLCQSKDSVINNTEVYIEVNSPEDVLDILRHFNLAWNLKESDIDNIVKEKKLNTLEGICLILEIQ